MNQHPLLRPLVLTLSSALLLSACGFHLRGQAPVPAALQPLFLACNEPVPAQLCQILRRQLTDSGVTLNTMAAGATQLQITQLKEELRTTAITSTAVAAEYDLRLRLRVDLISARSIPLLAGADVAASQIYRYDETNVLAKRREEDSLRQNLYRQLADQVIFRLTPFDDRKIKSIEDASIPASATP